MNRNQTRATLKIRNLAPHKRLGQNFLVREDVALRIVAAAGLKPGGTVLEVGVGLGALTRPLAEAVGPEGLVIGVEADSGIARLHEEERDLPENVRLIHADILKTDLNALAIEHGRLNIVANLPYAISSPFLFRLMAQRESLHSAVVMLQKEVADRLRAAPGAKKYGAPTVLLAACAEVRPLFDVGPEAFHPRPRVESTVLRLDFFPEPARLAPLGDFDRELLARVVRAAFAQRRKTLANALKPLGDKKTPATWLERAGIASTRRAETLALADFVRLCREMQPPC